ncbi:PAS domain S-box-containing protein [Devosia lucknowensis]|uniref:Blue-light-activated histidine kinase n=1 Tax=Devosia lucknowensis TaxID=1096929 RepID=A0A1Y6F5C3_9HYPH|nr:HWE histidine kinase domain-containing protein [Devosia lucknowensis]SMQ70065.1 PAS domain S-box-containing protein [Devosia lucknowensis]
MGDVDFGRIFEALPSPFMILDKDLRYVTANAAYLETTGATLDDLAGHYVMERFPEPGESGKRLLASFEKVLATGTPDTLAYLPYPIAEADGTVRHRYWTAVHVPLTDADGQVEFILQNTVDVTEFARLREAATLPFSSLSAATRLIERTREAEAASADFRRLFQQAPAFFAVLSGPAHVFTFASDSYVRLIGGRNVVGQDIKTALPEVIEQGFVDLLDRVFHEGHVHSAEGARVMLVNEPGQPAQETFLDFSYAPIRDAAGIITGVFVQGMDRTESVRAAQRQRLLIDELNHRVKNTLATVQSIASQTLRSTSDMAVARQAFEARIIALSKAHTMLSDRQWHDTEIGHLVCQELSVFDSEQVRYEGPVLIVNAKATVALALVLHEMAANSTKHGSLSVPEGTLMVNWHEDGNDNLVIDWVERGGPAAREPDRNGFGSRLLRTVITGEMAGDLDLRYDGEGLTARLTVPHAAYKVQEAAIA